MKRIATIILALAVLLSLTVVSTAPAAAAPPTVPDVQILYTAHNVPVGTVSVSNNATHVTVKYSAASGWEFAETHLAVTASGRVPHNPVSGRFVDTNVHRPPLGSYTYTIAIRDEWRYLRTELEIVAQAAVHAVGDGNAPGAPAMQFGLTHAVGSFNYARDLSSAEVCAWVQSRDPDLVVLDVRSPAAYASGNIAGAININYLATPSPQTFINAVGLLDKTKTYLVYCGGGTNGGKAAAAMRGMGFIKVYNLAGGYGAWLAAGGCPK